MPKSQSARRGELADRAYVGLRDLIIRGRLRAGAPVMEADVAARFGVSRTPVRQSLARLAQEGYLVAATEGRRIERVVAPLDPDGVIELWAVTGGLEGLAIRAVSTFGPDRRRQLAAALARVNDDLAAAAARQPRDNDRISELMTDFHVCFMDQCAGPMLRALYDTVRPHVRRYEWAYARESGASYAPSIREHRGIIDAVAAGDGDQARLLIEQHWENGARRTTQLMKKKSAPRSG